MGNPHRGEIDFEHQGKTYTICFDFYAQALLQRQTKQPTGMFFSRAASWGADDLLQLFYAGLFRRHRLTEEQVADIIDGIGEEQTGKLIGDAVAAAAARKTAQMSGNGADHPPPPVEVTSPSS
jgi:hypothetical protein